MCLNTLYVILLIWETVWVWARFKCYY